MWFTTALANLSLWSQGPVTAHPHTHTHTYPHKHIHRGSYCHGNQPLYDYSLLRRRIGTNLSQPLAFFIVRFSLSSLVVAAISSQPTSSPGLIPCFLVSSFHLFPSSPPTCFWQSWVWFVMYNLSTVVFVHFSQVKSKTLFQVNLHKNLRCSQRNMVKESLSFQEKREKNILLNRENLLVAP